MPRRPGAWQPPAALTILALVWLAALAPRAGASIEQFSTFDVERQEADDESLLDHLLTRPPRAWRFEWDRTAQGLRTQQGCLTSADWFLAHELRLRVPAGERARLAIDLRQEENDRVRYDHLDFTLWLPTRHGSAGLLYRPRAEKSEQDFALLWQAGADTGALVVRAAFTLEDAFNNLWAFRQTRVGEAAEPYERRPYEPALALRWQGPASRLAAGGLYLTPSRKRLTRFADPDRVEIATLWGTLGHLDLEARAFGIDWEARSVNHQAGSRRYPAGHAPGGRNFRRQWSAELAARREVAPRVTGEARWAYQSRDQRRGPPAGGRFAGVDRVVQIEGQLALGANSAARVGYLHDRITAQYGETPPFTPASRTESRLYLGFHARFGRVRFQVVEGFELDREPYEVWWVHDKTFVQIQAAF